MGVRISFFVDFLEQHFAADNNVLHSNNKHKEKQCWVENALSWFDLLAIRRSNSETNCHQLVFRIDKLFSVSGWSEVDDSAVNNDTGMRKHIQVVRELSNAKWDIRHKSSLEPEIILDAQERDEVRQDDSKTGQWEDRAKHDNVPELDDQLHVLLNCVELVLIQTFVVGDLSFYDVPGLDDSCVRAGQFRAGIDGAWKLRKESSCGLFIAKLSGVVFVQILENVSSFI